MNKRDEILSRIERVRKKLPEKTALLVSSEINRFYMTGIKYTDGVLLITHDGAYSFADFRYDGLLKAAFGDIYTVIMPEKSQWDSVREVLEKEKIQKLLFEGRTMSVEEYDAVRAAIPDVSFESCGAFFLGLRAIKTPYEIEKIKRAQALTDDAFEYILPKLSGNVTETEVALDLEMYMRKRGAEGISFDFICVSGAESAMPHGQGADRPLQNGFFTMDYGCIVDGYMSDMTRTVCLGKPTDEMKRVYDTVLRAHLAVMDGIHAGMTGKEADSIARDIINKAGYEGCFGHSLGHGVGIEIHEQPNLSQRNELPLPVGAVVTDEPGIYIPGKFGVRIENMMWLGENGCTDLTGAPRELIVIDR